jgi:hypothetical protein
MAKKKATKKKPAKKKAAPDVNQIAARITKQATEY